MADRTCSLAGCNRPYAAHGYCIGHLRRWQKTGDPGPVKFRRWRRLPTRCEIEGCADEPVARGLCRMHVVRWYRTGDAGTAELRRGTSAVGYVGVHLRLGRDRGRASDQQCRHCDQQAADWAYDHAENDPDAKYDSVNGRIYSVNPARYIPLCASCHQLFDCGRRAMGGR